MEVLGFIVSFVLCMVPFGIVFRVDKWFSRR